MSTLVNIAGRTVRSLWGETGTISRWEPLGSAMCDVLVDLDNGKQCWFASSSLRFKDGSQLPSRKEAQQEADNTTLRQLKGMRSGLQREGWEGAWFGKAILGDAIDGAIDEVEGRIKSR